MNPLAQVLRDEIEANGPIGFDRFMALALYHPELGYYERAQPRLGREGDYYTSVSVGPVFGELLGFRLARWLAELGDGPLHLVEAGAHDGRLATDLLTYFRACEPALAYRLEYWLLEPSERRYAWQRENLAAFGNQVRWAVEMRELPQIRGVVFSNELLDALPVHRLQWEGCPGGWRELGVTWERDHFDWTTLPGERVALAPELPLELRTALPRGYTLEVGVAARDWWQEAARHLEAGWLITLDYGDAPGTRPRPERPTGTLRAYRQHQLTPDVLADPGEQDLTAHVDFGVIRAAGEAAELETEELCRQETFLAGILADLEQRAAPFPPWTPARRRQCLTLLHPGHLGTSHLVLVQRRRNG
ncbi:MAG: SAM-dependent methyltransferase [Verrucomicrobiales bacterium]|nr:SAM-dependent methyltransferase [Verrucomicrobiales bacterium]